MKEKSFFDYIHEDCDEKPTIFERIKWKFDRIKDFFRKIKWFLQKIFRSHHSSDCDLWNLYSHLAPTILKKLKAFRDQKFNGYPSYFSEYRENEWSDKKEYEKAKEEGKIDGGGMDAWLEVLDEMIFAFEYIVDYDSYYNRERFLKKYNLRDPHEKISENKKVSYIYRHGDNLVSSDNPPEKENRGYTYKGEAVTYYNIDLEIQYGERAQKGLDLFSKFFMNLWD